MANSEPKPFRTARFRYSSYWDKWSLVLTERCAIKPGYGPTVEIDMTPVNGWTGCYADGIRDVNVRRHCTQVSPKDRHADILPPEVEVEVRKRIGSEMFDWLCHGEVLGVIDWAKYNDISNGGASLYACVKLGFTSCLPGMEQVPFVLDEAA